MKSLTEIIKESRKEGEPFTSEIVTAPDLVKHIGKTKFKAIVNHPYHRQHFTPYHTTYYRYHRNHAGFEHVAATNAESLKTKDGQERRRMVKFDLSSVRRTIVDAHVFHNTDNERHPADLGGGRVWHHIKSYREDK